MVQSKKTGGLGICECEFHALVPDCPSGLLHAPCRIPNGVIGPGWFWESREKSSNRKPADDLVVRLELCNCRRANYLLNVGPDKTGRLPAPAVEKLREIGKLREIHPWPSVPDTAMTDSLVCPNGSVRSLPQNANSRISAPV